MTSQKFCPQCEASFEGRSNQLYCSSLCKQRAFQESKTTPVPVLNQQSPAVEASIPEPASTHNLKQSRELSVGLETLRLQAAERIKRLEIEERQIEQEYEMEREDRQFDKDRQRSKWEQEALQLQVAKLDLENRRLEATIKDYPSMNSRSKSSEPDQDQESPNSGIGAGTLLLLGIAGSIIAAAINSNKQQTKPTNPPISKPGLEGLDGLRETLNRSKNGS